MRLISETRKHPEVDRAASKDYSQPRLTYAELDVDRGVIEASDSYRLVSIPVEVEKGDTSGPIELDALRAQRKASKREPASLSCNSSVRLETAEGVQEWNRHDVGQWPNVPHLVPSSFSSFSIGLNPTFLLELAKALGDAESVKLEFALPRETDTDGSEWVQPSELRPMRVTVPNGGASFGILMPIRQPGR